MSRAKEEKHRFGQSENFTVAADYSDRLTLGPSEGGETPTWATWRFFKSQLCFLMG